jgi:tryptophan 2,3-dioxygenase
MSDHQAALTYSSYLGLDDILGAQRPRTEEHDELLFIVIHQVYEHWFKQLLHEGKHLQTRLEDGDTPTPSTPSSACSRSSRPWSPRSTSSRR